MSSKKLRLHVGNLPHSVTQDELVKKLIKFGHINAVDIKHKREAGGSQILSTFSFVDIETDDFKLNKCLALLNGLEWDGHYLTVSLAKESFLQRLQRERDATQNPKATAPCVEPARNNFNESFVTQKRGLSSSKTFNTFGKNVDDKSFSHLPKYHHDPKLFETGNVWKPRKSCTEVEDAEKLSVSTEERQIKGNSKSSNKVVLGSLGVLKKLESFSSVWKDESDSAEDDQPFPYDSQSESEDDKVAFASEDKPEVNDSLLKGSLNGESTGNSVTNQAEERRIKSLAEKQRAFEEQKKAVKLALSDGNVARKNKKVIFNDDDDVNEDNDSLKTCSLSKSKSPVGSKGKRWQSSKEMALFEESDGDSDSGKWKDDFKLKRQFEGRKGRQLLNLQSRFNNDPRFALDERFAESDGDKSDSEKSSEGDKASDGQNDPEMAAEREQQYQILSDILGQPVSSTASRASKDSSSKPMVRFDPSKPNHMKYEVSREARGADSSKKAKVSFNIDNIKKKIQHKESEPEPVSKETFYKVSDSLSEAFKGTNDTSGFSLLQMFGPVDIDKTENHKNSEEYSKHNQQSVVSHSSFTRKFEHFSNGEKEEADVDEPGTSKRVKYQDLRKSKKASNQSIVKQESFFFQPDDSRLKEGADFFTKVEDPLNFHAFRRKRRELRHLVNRKIQRNAVRASAFKTKLGGKNRPRPTKPRAGRQRGRR